MEFPSSKKGCRAATRTAGAEGCPSARWSCSFDEPRDGHALPAPERASAMASARFGPVFVGLGLVASPDFSPK